MPVINPRLQTPAPVQLKSPLVYDQRPLGPEIRTMSRSLFDHQRIGITFKGAGSKWALDNAATDRGVRQRISNRRPLAEKSNAPSGDTAVFDDDQDAFPYRIAAKSALDSMMHDDSEENRAAITEALAKIHEPLQQYTVLFGALKEIDNRTDLDPGSRQSMKNAFNEMMTDLVNRDRGAIRKGLREDAEASPVSSRIDAARASRGMSTGLRDLRFKIGARAAGGIDEELTAMVMTKALLKTVGTAYAEEAMESVCTRLMLGLRTMSAIKETAYFLTVSDAVTFSIARTGFKIARDLRRDLVDKAGVLCRLHHAEAAVIMFTAAEQGWGKGKASQFVNQLVDLKGSAPLTRAKLFTIVRGAVNLLPATAWPQEKMSSRIDLLEDMDKQVAHAYAEIPLLTTQAERKEEEWRNLYAEGRAPTLPERA